MTLKRAITAEDLYGFRLVADCKISPDGQNIIFCVQWVDKATLKKHMNLWLVPTDGSKPGRQYTYGKQVDNQPRWSPDGQEIAFVSNRGDGKQSQIYLIPFYGGEARPLSQLPGDIGSFDWSPDGKHLVCMVRSKDAEMLARESDPRAQELGVVVRHITRLVYKGDRMGVLPTERWHLWRVEVATGEAKQLTQGEIYDELDPSWSPDGQWILFRSNRTADPDRQWDEVDLYLMPADGGDMHQVIAPKGLKNLPKFSPDGQWIAYYQEGGLNERWRNTCLWVVPTPYIRGGQLQPSGPAINLTQAFDFNIDQLTLSDMGWMTIQSPVWSSDSRAVIVQVVERGNTVLKTIPIRQAEGNVLQELTGEGVVEFFSLDRNGTKLAYASGGNYYPSQLWSLDLVTHERQMLTHLNEALFENFELAQVEEVWFKGAADNDLQGWIIKPPFFDATQKYPSILEIHGGPMAQYGHYFTFEFQFLAAQGYVIYFCNPRGGAGYGEAHAKAIYNDWGNLDYADLMKWVDLVAEKPYIDPKHMGVTGGSYGGFMTNWIICHTHRFQAAVTQRSLSNMISMAGTSDLAYRVESLVGLDKPLWEDVENYWRQSPLKYVAQVQTPILIIHNEEDLRCDMEQGEQFFIALKKLGVETELVRFPGETHDLSRSGRTDRRIARLKQILRWFETHLK